MTVIKGCLDKYFGGDRPEMAEYIPSNAKRILDVGCGYGKFGALLQARGSEMWGVELDMNAAAEASKLLYRVINGDIARDLELPEHYFDCVVFNDVLEHVADPWEVLDRVRRYLVNDTGIVVASIPNIGQIYNIYELLLKRDWQYRDQGILDRTHLRFFTRKSIVRLFKECGYHLIAIEGIDPYKNIFFELLNLICLRFIDDMKFLRFACVAKPFDY